MSTEDKSNMSNFTLAWESFQFRVLEDISNNDPSDIQGNINKYKYIVIKLDEYKQRLKKIEANFKKPHNHFDKVMMKKMGKLSKQVDEIMVPLINK